MGEQRVFRLDEISLYIIIRNLIRASWLIILAAVAAFFVTGMIYRGIHTEMFTSSATIAVVTNEQKDTGSYSSLVLSKQMAEVFAQVFESEVLLRKVKEDLGTDGVSVKITATQISETNLLELKAVDSNPEQAQKILESALKNYESVSEYLFSNGSIVVVVNPTMPVKPSNMDNMSRYQKISAIICAGTVIMLTVLASVLRFTAQTRDGARRNLAGKIRGDIAFERKEHSLKNLIKRQYRSMLINSPLVSMNFAESCRMLATHTDLYMKKRGYKIILVTSVAENEGKSSVAANLALAMAEKGRQTLLIDGDLKKPAQYKIFDEQDYQGIFLEDCLNGKAETKLKLYHETKTGLWALFQKRGRGDSARLLGSERMQVLLKQMSKTMDYVVIDSPPMALSSDAELLMDLADCVLMVVRQDWSHIRAINDHVDLIRKSPAEFFGFALNAFHREPFLEKQSSQHYRKNIEKQ
ncbi:MAG: Wzz/FepE/Etk N-terminal domain-containing protein [Catenibacillus sp.]